MPPRITDRGVLREKAWARQGCPDCQGEEDQVGIAVTEERLHRIGRLGYITYGAVQVMLSLLIVQVALGADQADASTSGAIREVAVQPLGRLLVILIGIGMLLLALWQALVAVSRNEGAWETASAVAASLAYAVLSGLAFWIAIGGRSGRDSDERAEQATGTVFDLPGGRWLVLVSGLLIVALGLRQVFQGVTSAFADDLRGAALAGGSGAVVLWSGRVGYVARGVAYAMVGGLLTAAALRYEPEQAGGLDEALKTLRDQPAGPLLLVAVAVGFASFGLFCFARARYEQE
jgi:hypothetical protein